MKFIENLSNDPRYNLAFEEYCFKNLPKDDDYVILWVNGPAIIIGKNQNTLEEVNLAYTKENGISIVRRVTGGGAVYHDLGNLNFSFIVNSKGPKVIDFKKYNVPIIKALNRLGINAELKGRNDLTLDGMKFSGIAQSVWQDRVLNHGTLLLDTKLDVLTQALNVKQDKIQSKGIKSIKSRVTNIKPHLEEDITMERFKEVLLKYIFEMEGREPEEYKLSQEDLDAINKLFKDKYSTWEWNFGSSPAFNYNNYKRFPFGSIDVRLQIEEGIIKECKIYGDFFGSESVDKLEAKLVGLKYDEDDLLKSITEEELKGYFGNITIEEFKELVF